MVELNHRDNDEMFRIVRDPWSLANWVEDHALTWNGGKPVDNEVSAFAAEVADVLRIYGR